jgi:hypothetical protein
MFSPLINWFVNLFAIFSNSASRAGIAANEKGLAFVGELAFRQPITEAQ